MYKPSDIKVIIATNNKSKRNFLLSILNQYKEFTVAGYTTTAARLEELFGLHSPDIILTDPVLKKSYAADAARVIHALRPDVGIIALIHGAENNKFNEMIQAGARGMIYHKRLKNELLPAIRTVYNNQIYFCSATIEKIYNEALSTVVYGLTEKKFAPEQFSSKQIAIIKLICQEYSNTEIGNLFGLSKRTVEHYRELMMLKMKVKNTAGIVVYAMRNKIFE